MKKYIILFITIIIPQFLYCQLEVTIDTMTAINIKYDRTGWIERESGPAVLLYVTVKNNSSENIDINYYYLQYNYNDSIYTIDCNDSYFYRYNIKPNQVEKSIIIGEKLISSTSMYTNEIEKATKLDFTNMLLQILPTLKLKIETKDKKYYYSTAINKVNLIMDQYNK